MSHGEKSCTESTVDAAMLGVGAGAIYGAIRSAWGVIPEEVGAHGAAGAARALGPSLPTGATMRIMMGSVGAFAAVGGIFAATECMTKGVTDHSALNSAMAGCVAGAVAGASSGGAGLNGSLGKTVAGCLGFALLAGFADFAGDSMLPGRSARVTAKHHNFGGTGSVTGAAEHGGHH